MAKKADGALGANVVCEFLEVAWHQLLYIRDLYPASVFARRRIYGISVKMCLHPEVVDYIVKVLETVRLCVERREVKTVVMVVKNSSGLVLEQYVFETGVVTETLATAGDGFQDTYLLELESSLRTALLRLITYATERPRLEEGCSFAILIKTQRDTSEKLAVQSMVKVEPMLWIEAEENQRSPGESTMFPVHSLASQHVNLQIFAKTHAANFMSTPSPNS